MKRRIQLHLILAASIVAAPLLLAQTPTASKSANAPAKVSAKDNTNPTDIGQRKFNANCSRCHSAPEQLSPSLTGTVVRHMRVRASLSAQDEKDILKFLAP
jgi:cytochrome c5